MLQEDSRGSWLRWAALSLGLFLLPALTLAATATYASNKVMGPTSGLVGYWTMNAQDINWATDTVFDRSGLGNNAVLNGATKPKAATGKVGQAMKFDHQVNSQNLDAQSPVSLDNLNKKTISLWVNSNATAGEGAMMSKTISGALTDGWKFTVSSGSIFFSSHFQQLGGNG